MDDSIDFDRAKIFTEVCENVEEHFFDPKFDSAKWKAAQKPFRKRCLSAKTQTEFANVINELLGTLNASHTVYLSRLNPKRYQLLGIMNLNFKEKGGDELFQYDGIGIDTRQKGKKFYITSVFDGFPAADAGLRFGDQIISVDDKPFHPILSFAGKRNSLLVMKIKRQDGEKEFEITPVELDGRSMFESAMDDSVRVIEKDGRNIGYVHIWSYAGTKYQEKLRAILLWEKLANCDLLVLDLRDGWGGADLNYLNLFRPPIANVESSSRSTKPNNFSGVWGKPVALLVNERSTSGKELFTYGFKKLKLGKVVGQKTAGAVVAGRCSLLSNGDALYMAVLDIKVDGKRLEHVGVEPDIVVEHDFTKSSGEDLQLKKAIEVLTK